MRKLNVELEPNKLANAKRTLANLDELIEG